MPYTPPAQADSDTNPDAMQQSSDPYIQELRSLGQGKSEDYQRYSDAELLAWKPYYQGNGKFKNKYGDIVDKPFERGANTPHNMNGVGQQGDYGYGWNDSAVGGGPGGGGGAYGGGRRGAGGGGMGGGGRYGYGGAPLLDLPEFKPPTYEEAMADPGYQAALKEGAGMLENSALARGVGRTSGTLKDLLNYGQGMAARQYGDVFNRAAQSYGLNTGALQAEFAPMYGSWETQYGGDLSKYLQREGNIYGLLS